MKKYTYTGKSNLVFTHENQDYLVHGTGPHDLPEASPIVKTHVLRRTLVEVVEQTAPVKKTTEDKNLNQQN